MNILTKSLFSFVISIVLIVVCLTPVRANSTHHTRMHFTFNFLQDFKTKAKAFKIARDLKTTEPKNHGPIYRRILEDTRVLKHDGLRREIVRLAREFWYPNFLVPLLKGTAEFDTERRFEPEGTREGRGIKGAFDNFRLIAEQMKGIDAVRIGLFLFGSSYPSLVIDENVTNQFLKHGNFFLIKYLSLAFFEEDRENHFTRFDRKTYRRFSSSPPIAHSIYLVAGTRERKLIPEVKRILEEFCWKAINEPERIGTLKMACVAVLLENHPTRKIKSSVVERQWELDGGVKLSKEQSKQMIIRGAKSLRDQHE